MKFQSAKVIAINVVVTFLEGAGAAWFVTGNQTRKEALVGAGAAGLSAVWNLIVKPFLKSKNILYNN